MTVRVVLVDDQPLVRAGLRVLIKDAPDLEVVGEAGNGAAAVETVRRERPDVVLMDLRMPGMDGIEATRLITGESPCTRVAVLTTFDDDDHVYGALKAGASGFLLKDMGVDDILAGVRIIAAGEALLAPTITRRLIRDLASRPEPLRDQQTLDRITDREQEVLALVGRGLTNTEIAAELFISVATVKAHIAHLLSKLGARDRVHLVILAYETALVGSR